MNLALSYLTIVEEEIVSLSPVPILTPYLAKERLWDFHLPLKGQNEIFYKFQEYTSSGSIGWLEGRNDRLNGYGGRVEQEVQDDIIAIEFVKPKPILEKAKPSARSSIKSKKGTNTVVIFPDSAPEEHVPAPTGYYYLSCNCKTGKTWKDIPIEDSLESPKTKNP